MCLEPSIGQECRKIVGPFGTELREQIADIGKRLDLIGLRTGHDAVENRGGLTAVVAAQKEIVFCALWRRPYHPLAEVVVDCQGSVLAVASQTVPAGQHVPDRLPDRTFGEHAGIGCRQPVVKLVQRRP